MLVTALVTQHDGRFTHYMAEYFVGLKLLKDMSIPVHCFLDKKIEAPDWMRGKFHVSRITLYDLPLYGFYRYRDPILPKVRTLNKDTLDYLIIQNSKPQFIRWAMQLYPEEEYFGWIDAGIARIFKDMKSTFRILKEITRSPKPGLSMPGCDGWPTGWHPSSINWYFCGGFFYGDRDILEVFIDEAHRVITDYSPFLTWEVNVWAEVARRHPELFNRYRADHNDSILVNY